MTGSFGDDLVNDLFGPPKVKEDTSLVGKGIGGILDQVTTEATPTAPAQSKETFTSMDAGGQPYRPYDRLVSLSSGARTPAKSSQMLLEAQKLAQGGFKDVYKEFNLTDEFGAAQKWGMAFVQGVGKALQPFAAPQQVGFGAIGSLTDLIQGDPNPGDKLKRGWSAATGFLTYGLISGKARDEYIPGIELVKDWGVGGTTAKITGTMLDFFADPLLISGPLKIAGELGRAGKLGEALRPTSRFGEIGMAEQALLDGGIATVRRPLGDAFSKVTSMTDVVNNVADGAIKNPAAFRRAIGEIVSNPLQSTRSFPGMGEASAIDGLASTNSWQRAFQQVDLAGVAMDALSTINAVARIGISPAPIKQAWQAVPLGLRMKMGEGLGTMVEGARFKPIGGEAGGSMSLFETMVSRWGTAAGIPEVNIQALIETGQTKGAGISRALQGVLRQRQIESSNIAMRAIDLQGRYAKITSKLDDTSKKYFDHLTTKVLDADDPAALMSNYHDLERFVQRTEGLDDRTFDFVRRMTEYDVYGALVRNRIGLEDTHGLQQYRDGLDLLTQLVAGKKDDAQKIVNQWLDFQVNPAFKNVAVQPNPRDPSALRVNPAISKGAASGYNSGFAQFPLDPDTGLRTSGGPIFPSDPSQIMPVFNQGNPGRTNPNLTWSSKVMELPEVKIREVDDPMKFPRTIIDDPALSSTKVTTNLDDFTPPHLKDTALTPYNWDEPGLMMTQEPSALFKDAHPGYRPLMGKNAKDVERLQAALWTDKYGPGDKSEVPYLAADPQSGGSPLIIKGDDGALYVTGADGQTFGKVVERKGQLYFFGPKGQGQTRYRMTAEGKEIPPQIGSTGTEFNEGSAEAFNSFGAFRNNPDEILSGMKVGAFDDQLIAASQLPDFMGRANTKVEPQFPEKVDNSIFDSEHVSDIKAVWLDEVDAGFPQPNKDPNGPNPFVEHPKNYDYDNALVFHSGNPPYGNIINELDSRQFAAGPTNLYGSGLYTTDSAPASAEYMRGATGANSTNAMMFALRLKKLRAIDMDNLPKSTPRLIEKMRKEALKRIEADKGGDELKEIANAYFDQQLGAYEGTFTRTNPRSGIQGEKYTHDQIFRMPAFQRSYSIIGEAETRIGKQFDRYLVQTFQDKYYSSVFTDTLIKEGYGGIRHVGGRLAGSQAHEHNVLILLGKPKEGAAQVRAFGKDGRSNRVVTELTDKSINPPNVKTLGREGGVWDSSLIEKNVPDIINGGNLGRISIGAAGPDGELRPLAAFTQAREGDQLVTPGLVENIAQLRSSGTSSKALASTLRAAFADAYSRGFRQTAPASKDMLREFDLKTFSETIGDIPGVTLKANLIPDPNVFRPARDQKTGPELGLYDYHLEIDARVLQNPDKPFNTGRVRKAFNMDRDTYPVEVGGDYSRVARDGVDPRGTPKGGFSDSAGRNYDYNAEAGTARVFEDGKWSEPRPVRFIDTNAFDSRYLKDFTGKNPDAHLAFNGDQVHLVESGHSMSGNHYRETGKVQPLEVHDYPARFSVPVFLGETKTAMVQIIDNADPNGYRNVEMEVTTGETRLMDAIDNYDDRGDVLDSFGNEKAVYPRQVSSTENPFNRAGPDREYAPRNPNEWHWAEQAKAQNHLRRMFTASENRDLALERIDVTRGAAVSFDTPRVEKLMLEVLVGANRKDTTAREMAREFQQAWSYSTASQGIAPVEFITEFLSNRNFSKTQIRDLLNNIGGEFWQKGGIAWRPPGEELLAQMHDYLAGGRGASGPSSGPLVNATSRGPDKARQDLPEYWQEALGNIQDIDQIIASQSRINEKLIERRGLVEDMYRFLEKEGGIIKGDERGSKLNHNVRGWRIIDGDLAKALKGMKTEVVGMELKDTPFKKGDLIPAAYYSVLARAVTDAKPGPLAAQFQWLLGKWKQHKVASPAAILRDSGSNFALASQAGIRPDELAMYLGRYAELHTKSKIAGGGILNGTIDIIDDKVKIRVGDQEVSLNEMMQAGDFLHSGFFFNEVSEPLSRLSKELANPTGNSYQRTVAALQRFSEATQGVRTNNPVLKLAAQTGAVVADLAGLGGPVTKFLGDKKGMVDMSFKGAVYLKKRAEGMAPVDAARFADDLFFNYENVPYAVDFLRRTGISPFASFQFLSAGRFIKNLYENPYAVHRPYRIPGSIEAANKENKDSDYDREQRSSPDYIRKALWIPAVRPDGTFIRDSQGRSMWMNLGLFLPETATGDLFLSGPGGVLSAASSPLFDIMSGLVSGKGYKGVPMYEGGLSYEQTIANGEAGFAAAAKGIAKTLWQFGATPWAPGQPANERIAKAIQASMVPEDAVGAPEARGVMDEIAKLTGQDLSELKTNMAMGLRDGPLVSAVKRVVPGPKYDPEGSRVGAQAPLDLGWALARHFGLTGESVQSDPGKPGSLRSNKQAVGREIKFYATQMSNALREAPPAKHAEIRAYYNRLIRQAQLKLGPLNEIKRSSVTPTDTTSLSDFGF